MQMSVLKHSHEKNPIFVGLYNPSSVQYGRWLNTVIDKLLCFYWCRYEVTVGLCNLMFIFFAASLAAEYILDLKAYFSHQGITSCLNTVKAKTK